MSLSPTLSSQITEPQGRWKWFLALGVLLLILGMAGITASTLLELTSVLVFGPMLLVSSIIQLLTAFFAEKGKESLLHFVAAGLEAVLGFLVMAHPLHRVVHLTVLVAVFLIVIALVRLVRALVAQSSGRGWAVMAGVAALILGVCALWVGWPDSKLWFVWLCIALDFLCHGVSWSALALAKREPLPQPTT